MDNPLRWLALVILEEAELPEFEQVARYVAENYVDAPTMTVAGTTDNLFTCTIGEYTAAVTLVPRPIPWSQLEGPCATAWFWPTAADALREHQAHLLVTLVDEGGKEIPKSTALTQLVAGVVANTRSCGVFWGPGRLVHPPQAFLDQAAQLASDDLPLFLWIDFRVEHNDKGHTDKGHTDTGGTRLFTTGLEALGYTELEVAEFQGDPQTLLEYSYNIAHYQLSQSKEINEGDTIGLTEEIQVVAHRSPSMFDETLEVVALEFQSASE
ncbi:MAG: DUF4261 domain-containing protein [Planctomycetes bacterium]|nr:DUF4261 domain-containing protein [Planctomycetota bacterium]